MRETPRCEHPQRNRHGPGDHRQRQGKVAKVRGMLRRAEPGVHVEGGRPGGRHEAGLDRLNPAGGRDSRRSERSTFSNVAPTAASVRAASGPGRRIRCRQRLGRNATARIARLRASATIGARRAGAATARKLNPGRIETPARERRAGLWPVCWTRARTDIIPALEGEAGCRDNVNSIPKLQKIVVNMGVGSAASGQEQDGWQAADQLIGADRRPAGQITKAKVRDQQLPRLRENSQTRLDGSCPCSGAKLYEFLDRLVSVALPVSATSGAPNRKSRTGTGNHSMGPTGAGWCFPRSTRTAVTFNRAWTSPSESLPACDESWCELFPRSSGR